MSMPGVQRPKLQIVLPSGRYVSGDHINKATTNWQGEPIADPKKHAFHYGHAVLKNHPDLPRVWGEIMSFIGQAYNGNGEAMQRLQYGIAGSDRGGLSLKMKDGDLPNAKGVLNPHIAGCIVFYCSSTLPIKTCDRNNTDMDPALIKRGYFTDAHVTINPNDLTGKNCGIYINPNIIRFLAYGEEIIGGITAEQAFGQAPAPSYLPPGAMQQPIAPGGFPQPQQPQPGFTPQPSPGYPQPMQQPYVAPSSQPAYAPPAGYPSTAPAPQYLTTAAGPAPNAMPYGAPVAPYPSNQMPAGFPTPGANQPPLNSQPPTGFQPGQVYINPATGQPVQPHPSYMQPPQR